MLSWLYEKAVIFVSSGSAFRVH